jgi:hypothetical protein
VITATLGIARHYHVATLRVDGRPHVAAVLARWGWPCPS